MSAFPVHNQPDRPLAASIGKDFALSHAAAHISGKTSWWYRLCLLCGLGPLLTGGTIYALWLPSASEALVFAGVLLLPFCALAVLAGLVMLWPAMRALERSGTPHRLRKILIALFCLLLNIPAAGGVMLHAHYVHSLYPVTIINDSTATLDSLTFTDPLAQEHQLAAIAPHSRIDKRIPFYGEGAVHYHLVREGRADQGILIGYITNGFSSHVTLRVDTEGKIHIEETTPPPALTGPW